MSKRVYLSVVAAAVAATFAGQASAAFTNPPITGAGASAVSNSLKHILLNTYCAPGVANAATVTLYDNDTGLGGKGSVYRFQCTKNAVTATGLTNDIDVSYDTSGGSWKGLTPFSPNLFSAAQQASPNPSTYPVQTVDISNLAKCGAEKVNFNTTIEGTVYTINYYPACPTINLTSAPAFGMTDVDASLFVNSAENQPLVDSTWLTGQTPKALVTNFTLGTELTGFPVTAFGMTFGIAASAQLYKAMQADQSAAGLLPAACVGLIETANPVANLGCAPRISRAQYRSIIQNGGGKFNTGVANLFTNVVPGTGVSIEVARRDRGSGTQATSNAFFLGSGCISANTEAPDLNASLPLNSTATYVVDYNFTTGSVQTALGKAANVIGVISADNDGNLGGGGFLRLDGVFPSNVNAANGIYDLWTEEQLHANPSITGDVLTFVNDLGAFNNAVEAITAYAGPGVINLTPESNAAVPTYPLTLIAAGQFKNGVGDATGAPATWYYQDNGSGQAAFCAGRVSY